MIAIDHIGIMARDAASSARFLAEILGLDAPATDGSAAVLEPGSAETPLLTCACSKYCVSDTCGGET